MSHISTYAQKIKDVSLFCQTCKELGHEVKLAANGENITVQQYARNAITDAVAQVHLKGWRYPVAVNGKGELLYDHWGSQSKVTMSDGKQHGTMELLGEALQCYNQRSVKQSIDYTQVESVFTTTDKNGDIVITLNY